MLAGESAFCIIHNTIPEFADGPIEALRTLATQMAVYVVQIVSYKKNALYSKAEKRIH
jgi:GAF domain-containing protein